MIAFDNCSIFSFSIKIPTSSVIKSGIPPWFDATTGVPHAIDSKATSPNASCLEGTAHTFDIL